MIKLSKKHTIILLFIICSLQIIVSIYIANKKNFLFLDEVFSYPAANNVYSAEFEFPQNTWMDSGWFEEFMSVDKENQFKCIIPYENQITDVHPPLFYLFLHIASSFVPGEFSLFAGVSFNIIFFVISSIVLYFLGVEIFGNSIYGLVIAFLYAISYGGLNTMVYIRMYMLVSMMILLHIWVYLKYFEKEKVAVRGYVFLLLTMVSGVLSQYYFLFIAFALGVWYTIKFICARRYEVLFKYIGTISISAIISLMIWPFMVNHLFMGGRGKEAQNNLWSFDGYFADLKEMIRIINNEMFTKMLLVILIGMAGLAVINYLSGYKLKKEQFAKIVMLVFVSIFYLLIVTKLAPYQVNRYVMPLYPLIYLLVVGGCIRLLAGAVGTKISVALCIFGFGGLSLLHIMVSGVPYTYEKNKDNIERFAITEEFGDGYALYISDNGECHEFYSSQVLRCYKEYYHVYDLNTILQVKEDMQRIEGEDSIVVYVSNTRDIKEVNSFIAEVFNGKVLGKKNFLDEDEDWDVYLLKI